MLADLRETSVVSGRSAFVTFRVNSWIALFVSADADPQIHTKPHESLFGRRCYARNFAETQIRNDTRK
jgi:hypothetical protein